MKRLMMLSSWLLCYLSFYGQERSGKLRGNVVDGRQKGLDGVTIQLLRSADKVVVRSAVSDREGMFVFDSLSYGRYQLSFTAVGFDRKTSSPIEISAGGKEVEVPAFILESQSRTLREVVIQGKRPYIEQRPDKTVINVEASPTNAGATALEVLEKSPGVTVDNEGNISLKGKQGVLIMMDGKPTYLSNADLANLLRNLPAASLDQIEIMTNPSSKYDAAGNSGIINIKTKKNQHNGANGSLSVGNTTALFRYNGREELIWRPTASLNLNYRRNKFNLFGNVVFNQFRGRGTLDLTRKFFNNGRPVDSLHIVNTLFRFKGRNGTLKVGLDYTPNKKNTVGIVLNGFAFGGRPAPLTSTSFANLKGDVYSRINSRTNNKLQFNNHSVNVNYKHSFDSAGAELTADLDYSNYDNVFEQMLSTGFFDASSEPIGDSLFLKGYLPSEIQIYSLKSDLVLPLKCGLKIEAGIKSSFVTSDNLVDYKRSNGDEWVPDARNNHFVYDENINAAYLNASREWKKWNLQGGLRLENTNSKGVQAVDQSRTARHYTNLFPSVFVTYKLDSLNQLTALASRRIQRPNYQDLNPFTFFLDSLTFRQGNPFLTPQFSFNYELIHSWKGKISTTLNYTATRDVISQILKQQKGSRDEIITFLTIDNIAELTNIGLAISAPLKVTWWWNTTIYGNLYRNEYKGSYVATEKEGPKTYPLDLGYTSFSLNTTNTFTLGKGWSTEVSAWYRYKTIEQLNLSEPMGQMSFGLAKNNWLKGKGSLRFNARDPFNWQSYRGRTRYGNIDVRIRNRWPTRQYGITFTYRFGKAQNNEQPRKRSGSTQDEQNRVGSGQ